MVKPIKIIKYSDYYLKEDLNLSGGQYTLWNEIFRQIGKFINWGKNTYFSSKILSKKYSTFIDSILVMYFRVLNLTLYSKEINEKAIEKIKNKFNLNENSNLSINPLYKIVINGLSDINKDVDGIQNDIKKIDNQEKERVEKLINNGIKSHLAYLVQNFNKEEYSSNKEIYLLEIRKLFYKINTIRSEIYKDLMVYYSNINDENGKMMKQKYENLYNLVSKNLEKHKNIIQKNSNSTANNKIKFQVPQWTQTSMNTLLNQYKSNSISDISNHIIKDIEQNNNQDIKINTEDLYEYIHILESHSQYIEELGINFNAVEMEIKDISSTIIDTTKLIKLYKPLKDYKKEAHLESEDLNDRFKSELKSKGYYIKLKNENILKLITGKDSKNLINIINLRENLFSIDELELSDLKDEEDNNAEKKINYLIPRIKELTNNIVENLNMISQYKEPENRDKLFAKENKNWNDEQLYLYEKYKIRKINEDVVDNLIKKEKRTSEYLNRFSSESIYIDTTNKLIDGSNRLKKVLNEFLEKISLSTDKEALISNIDNLVDDLVVKVKNVHKNFNKFTDVDDKELIYNFEKNNSINKQYKNNCNKIIDYNNLGRLKSFNMNDIIQKYDYYLRIKYNKFYMIGKIIDKKFNIKNEIGMKCRFYKSKNNEYVDIVIFEKNNNYYIINNDDIIDKKLDINGDLVSNNTHLEKKIISEIDKNEIKRIMDEKYIKNIENCF